MDNDIIRTTPYEKYIWGWDRLSHMFHVGTQNIPELDHKRQKLDMIKDFIDFSHGYAERKKASESRYALSLNCKQEQSKIFLSQPDSSRFTMSLKEALETRMTSRCFSGEIVSEKDLSAILFYTFGEIANGWGHISETINLMGVRKTSPGAGGIHAIQAYVTIMSIEGFEPGIYLYDSKDHSLSLIENDLSWPDLIAIMADQFYMEGLAFGVFMVSNLEKIWTKYLHSRAYREIFLDAGHLSQTFQLTATALSLKTWVSGYFRDQDLMTLLKINQDHYAPILFVGAGHGERTPLHPDMVEALDTQ